MEKIVADRAKGILVITCSRIRFSRCLGIHVVVLAAHSLMLALLYLRVSLVFDYGSWIPAFIP